MLVFWILFHVVIIAILVLDLWVLNRDSHELSTREALAWTAVWVLLAGGFALAIYFWQGSGQALAFTAGYLIELSLSVDNLFVFLALFASFSVPRAYQHRVLVWGILGAIVMRAGFILAGASLIHRFHWVTYIFAGFLVYIGIRFAQHPEQPDPEKKSATARLLQRILPFTSEYENGHFMVRVNGRWTGTPLLLVLLTIEATDLVFALDSIPAVLAISQDPFIVYTSNVFAILGLRSMYFALAKVVDLFRYLRYGLAAILVFIGAKMLLASVYPIPVEIALAVVAGIIILSIVLSLPRRAHPTAGTDEKAKQRIKTLIVLAAGWLCVLLGVAGLVLPFVPGIVLLVAGLMILAQHYQWARRMLENARRKYPKLWGANR
jgi:tellurite resistance protein TerC